MSKIIWVNIYFLVLNWFAFCKNGKICTIPRCILRSLLNMAETDFSRSQLDGPSSVSARTIKVKNKDFTIDKRYKILKIIGLGAYGVVVSVQDTITGELLAIKKIEKVFDHESFAKRALRELKIMRLLKHDNVLVIRSIAI